MTKNLSVTLSTATLILSLGCGSGHTPVGASSPSPSPQLSPSPTPTAPVATTVCSRLGNGYPKADCNSEKKNFQLNGQIDAALDALVVDRPALFNPTDSTETGNPRVLDRDGYFKGLIGELDKLSVCAEASLDGQTIYVKADNDRSESYRVLDNNGFVWRGPGSYVDACSPAAFPLAPIDHISWMFVTAYGFRCEAGVPFPDRGPNVILYIGCGAQVTATPKDDFGVSVPPEIHGKEIKWEFMEGADLMDCEPWKDEPFNLWCHPHGLGNVTLCATVLGVTGCVRFWIVPNPTPASS